MINLFLQSLGFKPLGALAFKRKAIEEFGEMLQRIPIQFKFVHIPLLEQALFEETFAISTAEQSELVPKEAKAIQLSSEIKARLAKYRGDRTLTAKQKYDRLENEDIQDTELRISGLSFHDLSPKLLLQLHHNLTVGLDDYGKSVGVSGYHPGRFRSSNTTRVGDLRAYIPPPHTKIRALLSGLIRTFKRRKPIGPTDILEFHLRLYAIHPFENGNKRVCRVLESMLLNHYGYSANRTISLASEYGREKASTNFFILESLLSRDPTPFVNFGLRAYVRAGLHTLGVATSLLLDDFKTHFEALALPEATDKAKPAIRAAAKAIAKLEGVFTHGEFVAQMKKLGFTLGVSQVILKNLKDQALLLHHEGLYSIRGARELRDFKAEVTRYLVRNGMII